VSVHENLPTNLDSRETKIIGRVDGAPCALFFLVEEGGAGERGLGARTKMELQVPHFQRVPATVLGEAAPEISDRVDELIRNIQKYLYSDVEDGG
jgi:hypothetical protein